MVITKEFRKGVSAQKDAPIHRKKAGDGMQRHNVPRSLTLKEQAAEKAALGKESSFLPFGFDCGGYCCGHRGFFFASQSDVG